MKCEMCGKETDGNYDGIPVCFEHYIDGTLKEWLKTKENEVWNGETCPDCGSPVIDKWSGVKCSNEECGWWFCY